MKRTDPGGSSSRGAIYGADDDATLRTGRTTRRKVGMRRFIGVISAAALALVLTAAPASARSDNTITMTCTGGQVIVSDSNSRGGQTVATTTYNAVNPFGEICTISP